ncbi:MAG TPA: class I SAM-dependent methyltransferase [Holophaga sp.]|nr:class I SAM-dependent methyltransferase [Holophaga sp.]
MMTDYYSETLSSDRLQRCYEIAPARVQRYLAAETAHVRTRLRPGMAVLELGCGYGRVLFQLASPDWSLTGIDSSEKSIAHARRLAPSGLPLAFHVMDATQLDFEDRTFDLTFCVQNGICAFHANEDRLFEEALRVTRPGGTVLFSSYLADFWEHRLAWFERQAEEGLIGPIDRARTKDGRIVCQDGFSAGTCSPEAFSRLARRHGFPPRLVEVDDSSLFLELTLPPQAPRPADMTQ